MASPETSSDFSKFFGSLLTQGDLSRLGRNYIEVGRLTEEFFPEHDIRLVAVSDNIDTDEGENELAPIRNLFNEWYARDISKKRRISNKIKGNAGEPMGPPPYGYKKDPDDPKRWVVDEEAAQVVRRIFRMTVDGYGTEQIATILSDEKVLTPIAYWREKGINRPGKSKLRGPYMWNSSTITHILSLQEYCGDILNFKTYSKSYKNKKRLENDRENWVIFKDVHESIIERAVFEQVQQKRGKIRKRRTMRGSAICSPAFWSAPTAGTTCTSISIKATPTSSISTAPTTRAIVGAVLPPIMSAWTSWSRWCWARSGG